MRTVYKARDRVRTQWREMLAAGRVPIIEEQTTQGILTVEISLTDYGLWFTWSFEDSDKFDCGTVRPYFDGAIQKRHGGYVLSFAEIDRMGYTLDNALELIWCNISDGILGAYNLYI